MKTDESTPSKKRKLKNDTRSPRTGYFTVLLLEALSITASVKSRLAPLDTPQSRSGAHLARPHHEHADAHALVVQLGRFGQRACDPLQIL